MVPRLRGDPDVPGPAGDGPPRGAAESFLAALALPAAAVLLFSMAWRYVRQGKRALLPWQTGLVWALVVWMLGFGLLRNLPAFSFLAPR